MPLSSTAPPEPNDVLEALELRIDKLTVVAECLDRTGRFQEASYIRAQVGRLRFTLCLLQGPTTPEASAPVLLH